MRYLFCCIICNTEFEESQEMNAEHKAFHCGIEARRIFTVPNTNRDKMYYFNAKNRDGSIREIRSRGLHKKYLKDNGYADATVSDCLSVKPKNNAKEVAKKLAKKCTDKIYEKGAMDWVKGKESPKGKDTL